MERGGVMFILELMPFFFSLMLGLNVQQSGMQGEQAKYFMMEIGPVTKGQLFEFDLVMISRSGKEVVFRQLTAKAPYSLMLHDEAFLILHGKSGRGKIIKEYRMTEGVQRSYQYFGEGEAIVVEFLPNSVRSGPTRSWSEGMRIAPRLTVTVMSKE